MSNPNRRTIHPAVMILGILITTSLACGSSTPQVVIPEPTSEQSESSNQPTPIQPTSPPATQASVGSARSNPAPVGAQVTIDDMTFIVSGVTAPADQIVADGNMFNSTPAPGQQYIFISISITCNRNSDASCSIVGFEFSLIDSTGISHDSEIFLAGVPGLLETGEFYGGATKTGNLAFISPISDDGLILKYDSLFGGEAYFSLR